MHVKSKLVKYELNKFYKIGALILNIKEQGEVYKLKSLIG